MTQEVHIVNVIDTDLKRKKERERKEEDQSRLKRKQGVRRKREIE